jgi:hypothetical protein
MQSQVRPYTAFVERETARVNSALANVDENLKEVCVSSW